MVGSRQPIRVRRGWLIEVRLPRLAGGLNEQIYMISTSNNPVSHGSDLLKIGIPKRIGRNYIGYIVLDEQVEVIPRFLINLAFLYFAYSPVGYNFSY